MIYQVSLHVSLCILASYSVIICFLIPEIFVFRILLRIMKACYQQSHWWILKTWGLLEWDFFMTQIPSNLGIPSVFQLVWNVHPGQRNQSLKNLIILLTNLFPRSFIGLLLRLLNSSIKITREPAALGTSLQSTTQTLWVKSIWCHRSVPFHRFVSMGRKVVPFHSIKYQLFYFQNGLMVSVL